MDKDASIVSSLAISPEKKIYVEDYFSLDIIGHGDITYHHGHIVDMYHVPSLSAYLLFISQLTQTGKSVELWLDRFFV